MKLTERASIFEDVISILFDDDDLELVQNVDLPKKGTIQREVSQKGKYELSFFNEKTDLVFSVEVDMEHKDHIFLHVLRKIQENGRGDDCDYLTCSFKIIDAGEADVIASSFSEMTIYHINYI